MVNETHLRMLKRTNEKFYYQGLPLFLSGVMLFIVVGCSQTLPAPPPAKVSTIRPIAPPVAQQVQVQQDRVNPFEKALREVGERCYKGRKVEVTVLSSSDTSSTQAGSGDVKADELSEADTITPLVRLAAFLDSPSSKKSDASLGTFSLAQLLPQADQKKPIRDLEHLAELADVEMARFRKDKSELLIIGPTAGNGPGLHYDDWLAMFQAVALHGAPGVSIDPSPDPDLMKVRYFGGLENTRSGAAFFRTDLTFKFLSTGFSLDCSRFTLMPPTMRTELELIDAEVRRSGAIGEGWHRVWAELTNDTVEVSANGLSMRVPSRRLVVKEEALTGREGRIGSAKEFAALVSANFLALAAKIPAFAQLQKQAGLVRLARWMIDQQIPIDQRWLENAPESVETPSTVPSITVTKASIEDRAYVRVAIYGGIDFRKSNAYGRDHGSINRVLSAAEKAESREGASWGFAVEGRQYRAVRLRYEKPVVVQAARETWERSAPVLLPKPYLLVFPPLERTSQELSGAVGSCPQLSPGADIVVRGEAYIWDKTKNAMDEAFKLIPEAIRATSRSGQLTLFLIHERGQVQVGTYSISRQPAYRENLRVSVMYWPQGTCVGSFRMDGGPPPSMRPVQYVPGYGASVSLAEWIGKLRREK